MRNILLCIIFLVVGCTPPAAYTAFCPVDSEQWVPSEKVCFNIKTAAPQDAHTLYIYARTCEAHRYTQRTLPLIVTQDWHHLKAQRTDTVIVEIADSLGNFAGKGIHHRDITVPLSSVYHTDSLIGSITIRPCTATPVHGISHIGVELR